jgi:lipopolysaccharide/colanic/teichoic acid biosynthesis glycosyltransferase
MKKTAVYLTPDEQQAKLIQQEFIDELEIIHIDNPKRLMTFLAEEKIYDAILVSANPASSLGLNLVKHLKKEVGLKVPVFWLTDKLVTPSLHERFTEAGVEEVFQLEPDKEKLLTRLYYLTQPARHNLDVAPSPYTFHFPRTKRLFDVLFAGLSLLLLLPLFLIVALLVKWESKGPVFYYSYRVGTGYRVFKFWKFRSMRPDADKLLASMKDLNQYQTNDLGSKPIDLFSLCATCTSAGSQCQHPLIDSKGSTICERQYHLVKKTEEGATFLKIANDPRVTRIGKFIRNTSIDELPQLYNVLRGDMSIVGNRPLPLYEAEKLTTDQYAGRFIAPAGITGLWQVSKRGKGGPMSEEERIALDNEYAQNYSLKKDIKIILGTIPALFQKENV